VLPRRPPLLTKTAIRIASASSATLHSPTIALMGDNLHLSIDPTVAARGQELESHPAALRKRDDTGSARLVTGSALRKEVRCISRNSGVIP
jgi:hypothetical protein